MAFTLINGPRKSIHTDRFNVEHKSNSFVYVLLTGVIVRESNVLRVIRYSESSVPGKFDSERIPLNARTCISCFSSFQKAKQYEMNGIEPCKRMTSIQRIILVRTINGGISSHVSSLCSELYTHTVWGALGVYQFMHSWQLMQYHHTKAIPVTTQNSDTLCSIQFKLALPACILHTTCVYMHTHTPASHPCDIHSNCVIHGMHLTESNGFLSLAVTNLCLISSYLGKLEMWKSQHWNT